MPTIKFQGDSIKTLGSIPKVGENAPLFSLCAQDLTDINLIDLKGKRVILNIFPSIDTPTCAQSVRTFNQQAANLDNTVILCVSADLPFAASRFCAAENINNVKTVSFFRSEKFAQEYGVKIAEGPLQALSARAVFIIDEDGRIVYSELVSELTNEPDYEKALLTIK